MNTPFKSRLRLLFSATCAGIFHASLRIYLVFLLMGAAVPLWSMEFSHPQKKLQKTKSLHHSMGSRTRWQLEEGESCDDESPSSQGHDTSSYRDSLFRAIENGQLKEVKKLYRKDQKVFGKFGATPLFFATQLGYFPIVQFLLAAGEEVNQQNTHCFKTRSQGQRRKERATIDEVRENFRDRLVEAGGFTLDVFSNGLYERLANSLEHPKRLTDAGGRSTSESENFKEILSEGGVMGSVQITNGTPIFAVANKDEITEDDTKIAEVLLKYGATLDCVDARLRSPTEVLEMKLASMAGAVPPAAPRCQHSFSFAKKMYLAALADTKLRRELFPIWFLFADSQTTTRLIEQECPRDESEKKIPHYAFFDGVAKWELDAMLPQPREAFDRYTRVKMLMPEKMRFKMLLKYLYLRGKADLSALNRDPVDVEALNTTISHLSKQSPQVVAKAIFAVHRNLFLNLEARNVAIKYARGETEQDLHNFLKRIDQLSSFVSFTIVNSETRLDEFHFWYEVAKKLLKLNDLFGASCIISALKSPAVTRLLGDTDVTLPDLANYKTYVRLKNEALRESAVIPCIYHEGTRFQGNFEALCLTPDALFPPKDEENSSIEHEGSLPYVVKAFMGDFTSMQTELRHVKINESEPLYTFFANLPVNQSNEFAAELLSLHAAKKGKLSNPLNKSPEIRKAEFWDTHDFWQWLGSEKLEDYTNELIESGITNGASFLEKFALARSKRFRELTNPAVHVAFGIYEGICLTRKTQALGNLADDEQFPVNLWLNPKSCFQWIMWLRNNRMSEATSLLIGQNIDTFRAFLERALNAPVSEIKLENEVHSRKLEHLKEVFLALNERPEDISNWRLLDIEAWLFQHGLSHFIPAMVRDNVWKADYFIALLYVLQNFKNNVLIDLGYQADWMRPVSETAQSTLFQSFEDHARRATLATPTKKERMSRLFFIKVLLAIDAIQTLPNFYKEEVRTLSKLKRKLHKAKKSNATEISEKRSLTLEIRSIKLSQFGLSAEQAEAIKALLD